MESQMIWIWLGIFIFMVVLEMATTDLVTIWFAIGALIAIIMSVIPSIPFWVEIIVFILVSLVSLLALRPLAHRLLDRQKVSTNMDTIIGQKAQIITPITAIGPGTLRLNGVIWTALNTKQGERIEQDTIVEVLAIDGNKLIVRALETTQTTEEK